MSKHSASPNGEVCEATDMPSMHVGTDEWCAYVRLPHTPDAKQIQYSRPLNLRGTVTASMSRCQVDSFVQHVGLDRSRHVPAIRGTAHRLYYHNFDSLPLPLLCLHGIIHRAALHNLRAN